MGFRGWETGAEEKSAAQPPSLLMGKWLMR